MGLLRDYWWALVGGGYLLVATARPKPKPKPLPGVDGPGGEEPDGPDEPDEPGVHPAGVVARMMTRGTPTAQSFYKVSGSGVDSAGMSGIVQRIPGLQPAQRAAYIQAATRSRHNWAYYATQPLQAPSYLRASIGGTQGIITVASMLPANDDAQAAFDAGQQPSRCVAWNRNPNSGALVARQCELHGKKTRGLLWLPPLEAVVGLPADAYLDPEFEPYQVYEQLGVPLDDIVPDDIVPNAVGG